MRAALAYATELGWPVFPVRFGGKEPLCAHGVKDATTDPDVIRGWWEKWPNANVGLACDCGRVCIDIDPRNGGDETWGKLTQRHGQVHGPVAITGGGGQHILVSVPAGTKVRGSIGEGVDVKAAGGYIVVAPSVHPSGKIYQWEAVAHPRDVAICEAPAWLMQLLCVGQAKDVGKATGPAAESFLGKCFDVSGWLGKSTPTGAVEVRCPWWHEHTEGTDGPTSSTVIFPPTEDRPLGTFHCSHGHCKAKYRGTVAALTAIPSPVYAIMAKQERPLFEYARNLLREKIAPIPTAAPITPDKPASVVPPSPVQFSWIKGGEVFAPLPPVLWVVSGIFLCPGRPFELVGYGYSGKTVAGMSLLLSVATGLPVWGKYSCKKGLALHFDHEVGKRGTLGRYQRLAYTDGITPDMVEDRLRICCLPDFRLTDPDAEDKLKRECKGASVAMIDSFRAVLGGGMDENASDARLPIDKLLRVSEATACSFILLHHSGKGSKETEAKMAGRGSSAIFDAAGTVLKLQAEKHKEPHVTVSKAEMSKVTADASGGASEPFWLRIEDVPDDTGANHKAGLRCSHV
jgi:hypothetical protein